MSRRLLTMSALSLVLLLMVGSAGAQGPQPSGVNDVPLPFFGTVNTTGTGFGVNNQGSGIFAVGVAGRTDNGFAGVVGFSANRHGVYGLSQSAGNAGVVGGNTGAGWAGSFVGSGSTSKGVNIESATGQVGLQVLGGKVGIGTTSPAAHVDIVNDTTSMSLAARRGATSSTSPSIYGDNNGSGAGILGNATANDPGSAGVIGSHDGGRPGVFGYIGTYPGTPNVSAGVAGFSRNGPGVHAQSTGNGTANPALRADATGSGGIAILGTSNSADAVFVVNNSGSGDLIRAFAGGSNLWFRVTHSGDVYAHGAFHPNGLDYAELLPAHLDSEPGDVLVAAPDGRLTRSSEPYQPSVVGVHSTKAGILASIDDGIPEKAPLALMGIVPVKATAENGQITVGDLIVASSTPGHAMRAGASPPAGTVIGKAMTGLSKGSGQIQMLVMLR